MIKIENIHENHKDIHLIHHLYEESFPDDEKAPFSSLLERLHTKKGLLLAYYSNEQFIGFTYLVKDIGVVYLFYFAIEQEYRNKGYGSQILQLLKEQFQDSFIFLEIEKVTNKLTQRRKDFYLRNDFIDSLYRYYFYVDYEVMYYGKNFDIEKCYNLFIEFTDGYVDVDFIKI